MGRAPCCDKANVKKGPWSPEEDAKLKEYIDKHGTGGNWIALPQKAGLKRCGKSCRLRWLNYLRPNIKHGEFSDDEDRIICSLFANIGSRWSIIAAQLPGRTDNDIKNYWNTKLKKKLMGLMSTIPYNSSQNRPIGQSTNYPSISSSFNYNNYYKTQTGSFTPYESTALPSPSPSSSSNLFNTNSATTTISTLLQSQGAYVGPTHNLLMFGGDQPAAPSSCSSSDGSCNNNNNNQVIITNIDGFFGEISPLEYSIEEINQLISTSNVCHNLDYFVEENKREELGEVMYY
ncbi:hypothetical protein LguiA_016062 [Lonicera macranthoides]